MMGLVFFVTAMGGLAGPIVCGYLLDTFHTYNLLIYFTIGGYALAGATMYLTDYYTAKKIFRETPIFLDH